MAEPVDTVFTGQPPPSPASDPEPEVDPPVGSATLPSDESMPDADWGTTPDEDVKMEPATPTKQEPK